jgi:hypothetical protein
MISSPSSALLRHFIALSVTKAQSVGETVFSHFGLHCSELRNARGKGSQRGTTGLIFSCEIEKPRLKLIKLKSLDFRDCEAKDSIMKRNSGGGWCWRIEWSHTPGTIC